MSTSYYRICLGSSQETSRRPWPEALYKFEGMVGEHIRSGMEPNRNGINIHVAVLRLADGHTVHCPFSSLWAASPEEIDEYLTAQIIHA